MFYFNTGKHSIKQVQNSGKTILLDDNSKWDVSSFDKYRAMMWFIGDKVNVKPYLGSKFKIERECRNGKLESVEATFIN